MSKEKLVIEVAAIIWKVAQSENADVLFGIANEVIDKVLSAQQSVQPTGCWVCECGYAMPEPLQSCVKCGTARR